MERLSCNNNKIVSANHGFVVLAPWVAHGSPKGLQWVFSMGLLVAHGSPVGFY